MGGLSFDGTHVQKGLPALMLSEVITQWIFDNMGIPKSIINNQQRITESIWNSLNIGTAQGSTVITGTDVQNQIAQDCAIKAIKHGKYLFNSNIQ